MAITCNDGPSPWLLLIFVLPSEKASERVQIWRKLQKFGAIPFRNAGYLLPNTREHQERFVWIATAVRSHGGEASVLYVNKISDLPAKALQELFREARKPDLEALIDDLRKLAAGSSPGPAQIGRLRRRFDEIVAVDFFVSQLRKNAAHLLNELEHPQNEKELPARRKVAKKDYQKRIWVTRPRPGIDRVSSAWLISRFIDSKPRFIFADDSSLHPKAVPFDMYGDQGFAHEGDHCTFETLYRAFAITDKKALLIGQSIHDADLEDGKFGRLEGDVINQILKGWAKQDLTDEELLQRGIDLIEGLYQSIS